jgi:dCTP deaminase
MKDDIMFINGKTLLNLAPIKNMIPTKEKFMGTSYGLSEAGYDIRIKQTIEYVYDEYGERIIVTHPDSGDQEILLGNCVLASSIEEFQMPNQVAAEVKDKSTHARNFLSVFNTAIENDWHGFLTLELVFHRRRSYTVYAGQGIAQIRFTPTTDEAYYGNGKYQNAGNYPQPALT